MDVNGSTDPQHGPRRPNWWILLAISLALIAIIFSHLAASPPPQESLHTSSTTTSTVGTVDHPSDSPVPHPVAVDPPPQTSTSVTPPTTYGGQTTTTLVIQPQVTTETFPGYLNFPENIVSTIPLTSRNGPVTASATWNGGASMDLGIQCGSAQEQSSGTSTATVHLDNASAACIVTISEAIPIGVPVSYTVTVVGRESL